MSAGHVSRAFTVYLLNLPSVARGTTTIARDPILFDQKVASGTRHIHSEESACTARPLGLSGQWLDATALELRVLVCPWETVNPDYGAVGAAPSNGISIIDFSNRQISIPCDPSLQSIGMPNLGGHCFLGLATQSS